MLEGDSECEIIDILAVDKLEEGAHGHTSRDDDSDLSAVAERIATYELYGDEGELGEVNKREPMGER